MDFRIYEITIPWKDLQPWCKLHGEVEDLYGRLSCCSQATKLWIKKNTNLTWDEKGFYYRFSVIHAAKNPATLVGSLKFAMRDAETFCRVIMAEYDGEDLWPVLVLAPRIWDVFGLSGDDAVDHNGGHIISALKSIFAYVVANADKIEWQQVNIRDTSST